MFQMFLAITLGRTKLLSLQRAAHIIFLAFHAVHTCCEKYCSKVLIEAGIFSL